MARKGKSRESIDDQAKDIPPDRAGLPARDSIVGVETFVSPDNQEFKILHTSETDAYDQPPCLKQPRRRRRSRAKPENR